MSLNFIFDPTTNNRYSIFSDKGRNILKSYIKSINKGGAVPEVSAVSAVVPTINRERKSIIDIDREAEFSDLNRELKGLSTDIVVNDFFKSEECLYNFLMTVYTVFEKKINRYIETHDLNNTDIFFTFKGGNILRIIYKELILELPGLVGKKLNNFYKSFFKRSDADFSIYINPKLENYNDIYDEWCIISYYLQDKIRKLISENLTDYFDYFKYNKKFSKKILEKNLINFTNANSLTDVKNYKYNGAKITGLIFQNNSTTDSYNYNSLCDFIIEDGKKDTELIRHDLKDSNSFMYISLNKTLEFTSGDGGITKFALIRTKVNFNLLVEKNNKKRQINMSGELIDVSIPHRKDKSINEIFDKLDKAISRYTLTEKNKSFEFNSYSLEFLIEDLEKILFHVAEYPWDDKKYVKRLNRLCYLYFLDMFIKQRNNYTRKNLLKTTFNKLDEGEGEGGINSPIKGNKPEDSVSELDRLMWYYTYVKFKTGKKYKTKFEDFTNNIKNNLNELLEGFETIDIYCKNGPGDIKEEGIYSSSISGLI